MAGHCFVVQNKKLAILARLIRDGEDDLVCDLAETYGLYDYRELPPGKVAVLALGLRDDSRTKRRISGSRLTMEQALMAAILDGVKVISWKMSAKKGRKYKERSVLRYLMGEYDKEKDDLEAFETIEEYEAHMSQFEG